MITLRQLRYFSALAEHRHFGRAAAACAISQPALSMQLRELEKHLGGELVERRTGDVLLTDLGSEVARRAERMLAAARDLVDLAHQRRQGLSGVLTLGVIPTLAPYVLPQLLPKLRLEFPGLRLELRETQTKLLLDELARGALDVVMLALPIAEAEFETVRLFDDPFLLAMPADEPCGADGRLTRQDIDQRRLILLEEGHCLRDQALSYCEGARPDTMGLGATSLATVLQMVASGYGVTLVPQIAVAAGAQDRRVKLLRFAEPQPHRTIGLAWRQTSPRKADFRVLGELIAQTSATTNLSRSANFSSASAASPSR